MDQTPRPQRAADVPVGVRLPSWEHGRTLAALLSDLPPVQTVRRSEDLAPAIEQARALKGAPAHGERVDQHRLDTMHEGLVLVRGFVARFPQAWALKTDTGVEMPLQDPAGKMRLVDGESRWFVVGADEIAGEVWLRAEYSVEDCPEFAVRGYGDSMAESVWATRRRFECLDLLDFHDLGVHDPDQQRQTYLALLGLIGAAEYAEGVRVDGRPLHEWAQVLLAMSAARAQWQQEHAPLLEQIASREQAARPKARPDRRQRRHSSGGREGGAVLPPPRLIAGSLEAEKYAVEVMQSLGFTDARLTRAGSDGGVDVRARGIRAQVKMHGKPIGSPDMQKLSGIAAEAQALGVFFSLSGYSRPAMQWALKTGVACFAFTVNGSVEPVNSAAKKLCKNVVRPPVDTADNDTSAGDPAAGVSLALPSWRAWRARRELKRNPLPEVGTFPVFDETAADYPDAVVDTEAFFARSTSV